MPDIADVIRFTPALVAVACAVATIVLRRRMVRQAEASERRAEDALRRTEDVARAIREVAVGHLRLAARHIRATRQPMADYYAGLLDQLADHRESAPLTKET